MPTRLFTNDFSNTSLKKLGGIFDHNPDIACFGALVGYLRAELTPVIILSESFSQ
jgi:hypothetical protein